MRLDKVLRNVERAALDSLRGTIEVAARGIGQRAPQLTGDLVQTLSVDAPSQEGSSIEGSVSIGGPDSPAGPIEFGTVDTPPHAFYRPSVAEAKEGARSGLIRNINQAIR